MPKHHREYNPVIEEHTAVDTDPSTDGWIEKAPPSDGFDRSTDGMNSSGVTTQSTTLYRSWDAWEGDKATSGGGIAARDYSSVLVYEDPDDDGNWDEYKYYTKEKVRASAYVYGSAWAYSRFYDTYTPTSNGNHTIRVEMPWSKGDGTTGSITLSIYVEDSAGYINKKQADTLSDTDGYSAQYRKTFNLDAGETYRVGFETYGTTQTGGGGGNCDYETDSRGVSVGDSTGNYPSQPHYYYEIETP